MIVAIRRPVLYYSALNAGKDARQFELPCTRPIADCSDLLFLIGVCLLNYIKLIILKVIFNHVNCSYSMSLRHDVQPRLFIVPGNLLQ